MLAWAFYPLLILAVILTVTLVILLIKEKGFHLKRLGRRFSRRLYRRSRAVLADSIRLIRYRRAY
nr:hypothetical protein [Actinobacillus pleuropneumoniae]